MLEPPRSPTVLGYESVSASVARCVHMTTPAVPVCSIDSVQADTRRGHCDSGRLLRRLPRDSQQRMRYAIARDVPRSPNDQSHGILGQTVCAWRSEWMWEHIVAKLSPPHRHAYAYPPLPDRGVTSDSVTSHPVNGESDTCASKSTADLSNRR
jgi:hypothetical protein